MSGVEVITSVADNLLTGDFLSPPAQGHPWALGITLLAGLLTTLPLTFLPPALSLPLLGVAGVALCVAGYAVGRHGGAATGREAHVAAASEV